MRGVMKKISSESEVLTVRCLNRLPRYGISPSKGTCEIAQRILRLDDAANHHRAAVGHQHLRGGLLRDQGRVAG